MEEPAFFSREVARRSEQETRQYKGRVARRAEAYFCGCSLARSYLAATEMSSDFRSTSDRESALSTVSKRNEVMASLSCASTASWLEKRARSTYT